MKSPCKLNVIIALMLLCMSCWRYSSFPFYFFFLSSFWWLLLPPSWSITKFVLQFFNIIYLMRFNFGCCGWMWHIDAITEAPFQMEYNASICCGFCCYCRLLFSYICVKPLIMHRNCIIAIFTLNSGVETAIHTYRNIIQSHAVNFLLKWWNVLCQSKYGNGYGINKMFWLWQPWQGGTFSFLVHTISHICHLIWIEIERKEIRKKGKHIKI